MTRTVDYDRLASSAPLDAKAAMVTSGTRFEAAPDAKPGAAVRHEAPPPTLPVPAGKEDLTGRRVGRLRVVGWLGKLNPKKDSLWLVRCVCGLYEHRTAKAVRNPANAGDRCHRCRKDLFLRRASFKQAWGRWPGPGEVD